MKWELIVWLVTILAFATWDWFTIEKEGRSPNKLFRLGIRVIVSAGFGYWYHTLGYIPYWTTIFTGTTFAFLFPLFLNLERRLPPHYLSAYSSWYDKIMLAVFKYRYIVFWFLFMMALIGAGLMFFYGKCTWTEINDFRLRANC